ncbi:MAG TPA: GNAT family N-acyltransferase [Gammaproteobacteria bacterium]|jgi:putative hemolysin|nr:GNAT family N-acyltransferase [Gammaproteobacteria bacterium]
MSANPELLFDATHEGAAAFGKPELFVGLARDEDEIRAAQRLRYQVFAEEMGAQLHSDVPGLDVDPFDAFCRHLIVRDRRNGEVVACMRVLLDSDARLAGSFYSETEFELGALITAPGRVMEIGRVCVHPEYRGGMVVSMLWAGLARFFQVTEYNRIIGCASIPLGGDGAGAIAAFAALAERYMAPEEFRVRPKLPLPLRDGPVPAARIPALLLAYMRLGAKICGEPCWDPDFNTADLVVLLNPADLRQRYAKRFLKQAA